MAPWVKLAPGIKQRCGQSSLYSFGRDAVYRERECLFESTISLFVFCCKRGDRASLFMGGGRVRRPHRAARQQGPPTAGWPGRRRGCSARGRGESEGPPQFLLGMKDQTVLGCARVMGRCHPSFKKERGKQNVVDKKIYGSFEQCFFTLSHFRLILMSNVKN